MLDSTRFMVDNSIIAEYSIKLEQANERIRVLEFDIARLELLLETANSDNAILKRKLLKIKKE